MAWPNPTFTARSFGALAGDLSALMVAVNQREAAMGSVAGSGTLASSGTTVTGTSTDFLADLDVGDTILVSGQKRIIDTITDSDTLDTTIAFSPALSAEAFRYISLTKFTIADGTKKAEPTASDLSGFVFGNEYRGTKSATGTLSSSGGTVTGSGTAFKSELESGSTITATGTANGTGTLESSGTTVEGSGTSFTTELEVLDTITADGQTQTINTITDNDTLDTYVAFDDELSGDSFTFSREQHKRVNTITNDFSLTTTVGFDPVLSDASFTITPGDRQFRDAIIEVQTAAKALVDRTYNTGTSTIQSSSGTTVTGFGTSFLSELAVGDTILVVSDGVVEQAQEVKQLVSNTSLITVNAFSPALSSTEFKYITLQDSLPLFIESTTNRVAKVHQLIIDDIDIEDLTGSTGFTTTFDWWDQNVWERLRLYLDSLTSVYVADQNSGIVSELGRGQDSDRQTSWDDAIAAIASGAQATAIVMWRVDLWAYPHPDRGDYLSTIVEETTATYDFTRFGIGGTIAKSEFEIVIFSSGGPTTHVWDGVSVSIPVSAASAVKISANNSASLAAAFSISGVGPSTPSTVPFNPSSGTSIVESSELIITPSYFYEGGLGIWVDISNQLTDQA